MYQLALLFAFINADSFSAVASCPVSEVPVEVSTSAQNLTSPGYPDEYESNLECKWILHATGYIEATVNVTVLTLDLENSTDCQHDSLKIVKGFRRHQRVLAKLCGTIQEPVSFLAEGAMNIEFTSNGGVSGNGFVLQFQALLDVDEDGHERDGRSDSWGIVVIAVCVVVACVLALTVLIIFIKSRRDAPKQVNFDSPFASGLPTPGSKDAADVVKS